MCEIFSFMIEDRGSFWKFDRSKEFVGRMREKTRNAALQGRKAPENK